MKIHEYQGKEILKRYGVPVPRGILNVPDDEVNPRASCRLPASSRVTTAPRIGAPVIESETTPATSCAPTIDMAAARHIGGTTNQFQPALHTEAQ